MVGSYKFKTMWLELSFCDSDGQFKKGFGLELRSIDMSYLDGKDMIFDLIHTDGEKERIRLKAHKGRAGITSFFRLGQHPDFVSNIRIVAEYPNSMPISKEEYRKLCGTGMLLNKSGHYWQADENVS